MIKIFRDLTYIIRECKSFSLHVLAAVKFLTCQQLGFAEAGMWYHLGWSFFPSWPLPCSCCCCRELRCIRCSCGEWRPLTAVHFWGLRLQSVNTILYFIAIPGLWAWSLPESGILITHSWCCQAFIINNKLPPQSWPSVLSFGLVS